MEFNDVIRERFSVRQFDGRPIEEEKLHAILEAGRVAPTARNLQPWRVNVIRSAEGLEKIRSLSRCTFGAPVVLLFTYDENEQWRSPLEEGFTSGHEDVSIAATHMMLAAWNEGIGSCWVNLFPNSATCEAFGLPKSEKAVLLMPIGYPAANARPAPLHEESKELGELVREL